MDLGRWLQRLFEIQSEARELEVHELRVQGGPYPIFTFGGSQKRETRRKGERREGGCKSS